MTARNELSDWLAIADRIIKGEFRGCDDSTRKSLIIGLQWMSHETARAALEELERDVESRKRKVKV